MFFSEAKRIICLFSNFFIFAFLSTDFSSWEFETSPNTDDLESKLKASPKSCPVSESQKKPGPRQHWWLQLHPQPETIQKDHVGLGSSIHSVLQDSGS